jgi:hypothetical protein
MKRFATAYDSPFPYLHDETQTVARGVSGGLNNAERKLKYRGQLDEGPSRGRPESLSKPCVRLRPPVWRRPTKKGSIGCSIKWMDP